MLFVQKELIAPRLSAPLLRMPKTRCTSLMVSMNARPMEPPSAISGRPPSCSPPWWLGTLQATMHSIHMALSLWTLPHLVSSTRVGSIGTLKERCLTAILTLRASSTAVLIPLLIHSGATASKAFLLGRLIKTFTITDIYYLESRTPTTCFFYSLTTLPKGE